MAKVFGAGAGRWQGGGSAALTYAGNVLDVKGGLAGHGLRWIIRLPCVRVGEGYVCCGWGGCGAMCVGGWVDGRVSESKCVA